MSLSPLEKRTAGLELALEQTASFGEALLTAFRSILDRVTSVEGALEQTNVFNASVPSILREITSRLAAVEQGLKEGAASGDSSEKALTDFSRRMDALKQAIPKILEGSPYKTPGYADVYEPDKPARNAPAETAPVVAAAATDPAISGKLREAFVRMGALEATLGRLATQMQGLTQSAGQNTAGVAALDALRDTLKSVIDRMGMIESSASKLSSVQPQGLNPFVLEPIKDSLKGLSERVSAIEIKISQPLALAPAPAPAAASLDPALKDAVRKLAERVGDLEARADLPATGIAVDDIMSGTARLLAQASKLYPKTKTVVFVGGEIFGDNIKYAYLAFHEFIAGKDIAVSLLCATPEQFETIRAAGLPCISPNPPEWSPEDAKTLISAKVAVLDDVFTVRKGQSPVPHALLQGAKFIQLWHGIPFKEIGFQNLFPMRGSHTFLADTLANCGPYEVMVAPSSGMRREWERWFSFREFAPLGLPRTDIFFQNLTTQDRINVDERTLDVVQAAHGENRRVILYAPTFRDHNPVWFEDAGLDALASHCAGRGWLLYVNLHPREQGGADELRSRHPNIQFIAPGTDIYPIAKYADCLVTDYASLAFDFLFAEKPVVFYRPDHADYTLRARTLVPNHEALLSGPVTSSIETLIGAVADVLDRPDMNTFRETRINLRKRLFDYSDGKACSRLCSVIQRHLEPGIRFVPVGS